MTPTFTPSPTITPTFPPIELSNSLKVEQRFIPRLNLSTNNCSEDSCIGTHSNETVLRDCSGYEPKLTLSQEDYNGLFFRENYSIWTFQQTAGCELRSSFSTEQLGDIDEEVGAISLIAVGLDELPTGGEFGIFFEDDLGQHVRYTIRENDDSTYSLYVYFQNNQNTQQYSKLLMDEISFNMSHRIWLYVELDANRRPAFFFTHFPFTEDPYLGNYLGEFDYIPELETIREIGIIGLTEQELEGKEQIYFQIHSFDIIVSY